MTLYRRAHPCESQLTESVGLHYRSIIMEMVIHRGDDGRVDRIEYAPPPSRMAASALVCILGATLMFIMSLSDVTHCYFAYSFAYLRDWSLIVRLFSFPLLVLCTTLFLSRARLYAKLFRQKARFILGKDCLACEVRGKSSSIYRWNDLERVNSFNYHYQLVFRSGPGVTLPPKFWEWHCGREFLQELLDATVLSKVAELYVYEPEE